MDTVTKTLADGEELSTRQVNILTEFLLDETAPADRKKEVLRSLTAKGESTRELSDFVAAFLKRAVDPQIDLSSLDGPTIDVCGTGGDKLDLFNVSTTSMFVVAAAGGKVVKHGNRGITSKSGGADVLEALGIRIDLPPERDLECLVEAGVTFLFAPDYHPSFKNLASVRKELAAEGTRTLFNLIGPLLNPARPECQLIGVSERRLTPIFAEILQRLGRTSGWAIHGTTADQRGVDEVSLMGKTFICKAGLMPELSDEEIHPSDFGLEEADLAELKGGDAVENAKILEDILSGAETGPKRDITILNAGAAIACCGLADHMTEGIEMARDLIDDGAALDRLRTFQKFAK